MGGKGVAQRMDAPTLDDARCVARSPVRTLGRLDAQRTFATTRAEDPVPRFGLTYIGSQKFQQRGRQQGVARLATFTTLDTNTHTISSTVNVSHPQRAGLKHPQPCGVDRLQFLGVDPVVGRRNVGVML